MEQAQQDKEIATLAGGCFWCLEAVYDRLRGVESVESGYMGGQRPDPTYEAVCNGDTGHAEVVRHFSIRKCSVTATCWKSSS
jgi:peptide-methionine (S)-S-oxide reductase